MVKVEYILFDTLQWENVEGVIYADNLDKALEGLNKEYPLEYRWKPYEKEDIDSLSYDILEIEYIIENLD
jgi:hypothetical protein